MKASLNSCPVCGESLVVDRYHCDNCDTSIQGRFENGAFPGLPLNECVPAILPKRAAKTRGTTIRI